MRLHSSSSSTLDLRPVLLTIALFGAGSGLALAQELDCVGFSETVLTPGGTNGVTALVLSAVTLLATGCGGDDPAGPGEAPAG